MGMNEDGDRIGWDKVGNRIEMSVGWGCRQV